MKSYSTGKWIWIFLGGLSLIIRYTVSAATIEEYYSRGVFLWIRRIIDIGFGWFPFPLIYLFFFLLVAWLVRSIMKTDWNNFFQWSRIGQYLLSVAAFLGGVAFFFFFLWGFNYGRIPFTKQLSLQLEPIPIDTLKERLNYKTEELLVLREQLAAQRVAALDASFQPTNMEQLIRENVVQSLKELNYPTAGKVRGRILKPKGIFLRFSSAGLYWPFVGEGNIDGGLHPLQQPFTMAHEIAHGYGITNEGICNFIAYLACQKSSNAFIKYGGAVSYWRYLAGAYQQHRNKEYWSFREQLPKGFLADMDAINNTLLLYPDIMPRFRNFAYDKYLKSQGISEGLQSYSQIVMLVEAWEKRGKNAPIQLAD